MSDIAITATGHRGNGTAPLPPPQGYRLWRRARWAGYVLLGLQLLGYLVWSAVLYQRYALTSDFAMNNQAWYMVAHGHLDPISTPLGGVPFYENDGEFIYYALAPLYWIFHAGIVLQWAQDLSIAGAELVAFTWLCDLARRHCAEADAAWLGGLGLLLFMANPWLWTTLSFDVHSEAQPIFFAVFLAWDLSRGKRRAWVWAVAAMLSSAPDASYVIGIGLGGVLAGRRTRRMGAAIAATSIVYMVALHFMHGEMTGSTVAHQASGHPFSAVHALWAERTNIIANLAPAGLVGICAPLFLPLALVVIIPNAIAGTNFAEPVFQNVPLYVLIPVGTVAVLAWLLQRHRRTALVLAGVLAAQAIGWAAIWGPRTPAQWLRISSSEAATLASVQARIPASAEVIASQGIIGRFAQRTHAWPLFAAGGTIPLQPDTWFLFAPTSGVETVTPMTTMAMIGEVAGPLHARLVTHANGVWVFQLAQPGIAAVTVPGGSAPLPAWAAAGAASVPVLDGAPSYWHMAATGAKGYVADGIEWQEDPGRYRAEVTLSVTSAAGAPVNVEVWDDNTNTLLARQAIPSTDGIQEIVMPVTAPATPNATAFNGWGPFRADFVTPPPGQRIEVRVWSPGGAAVNVYSAELTTVNGSAITPVSGSDQP